MKGYIIGIVVLVVIFIIITLCIGFRESLFSPLTQMESPPDVNIGLSSSEKLSILSNLKNSSSSSPRLSEAEKLKILQSLH